MGHAHRFSVTPVKGTQLHHPEALEIAAFGVPNNRRFFFILDPGSPYDNGALAPLMPVVASYADGTLRLELPDGSTIEGDTDPEGEPMDVSLWGRTALAHRIPGPWDLAISALLGKDVHLVQPVVAGAGNDEYPITLVSLGSLASLSEYYGGVQVESERFRMTIDIDGVDPYEEDTWEGKRVSIGTAVLQVRSKVPRCLVTTMDPRTGNRDLDTLKAIARTRERTPDGLPFGMYAEVLSPGTISVGDPITLLG